MADTQNTVKPYPYYPPVSFYFQVIFNGVSSADVDSRFQEVSGLSHEIGTEDLPEGGENRFSYRLPTKGKYANLVLKRGTMVDSKVVSWITDAIDSFIFSPIELDVVLLNDQGKPLVKWNFKGAYPVKWSNSDLKSTDNAVLVETLEIAYMYFTKTYHT